MSHLRIIRLVASNILGIKAVEINPEGNVVVISGKNTAGKTSVLNCIYLALGGGEASRAIKQPLREGEDKGIIELDLSDGGEQPELVRVRREYKGDETKLVVENAAGARFPSPQAMLDKLIGKLSFDPVAFAAMDDKLQVNTLRELTGLDFTDLDTKYKEIFDSRTLVNREVRDLEGQIKEKKPSAAVAQMQEVDVAEVRRQLDEANALAEQRNKLLAEVAESEKTAGTVLNHQADLFDKISELQREREQGERRLADLAVTQRMLDEELQAIVVPDTDALLTQLTEASNVSVLVSQQVAYKALQEKYAGKVITSETYTEELEMILADKANAIAAAAMPIEGLGFEGDTVAYNGIPFKQCSAAEQLRVSLAIAMKLNPEIRVIRIQDASLLDSTNMKVIEEMAGEQDFQVWAEVVADGPGVGIYMEAGEVSA